MAGWGDMMRGVPDEQLREATAMFRTVELSPGQALLDEDQPAHVMAYLLSGSVELTRDGVKIGDYGSGQIFGAMSMVCQIPAISAVHATEAARALLLDHAGYMKLVATNNPVVYRLESLAVSQMASRLRELNRLVREHSSGQRDRYARPNQGFFAGLRKLVGAGAVGRVDRAVSVADVIGGSPLFTEEATQVGPGLAAAWEHVVFKKGETLCEQGDEANGLYLVGYGVADVYVALDGGKIHKLGSVEPGEAVGMTAMLDGKPRGATVIATEQVDALRMSRESFVTLMAEESAAASALRRAVIRAFADQVEEAGSNVVAVAPADRAEGEQDGA